MAVGALDSTHVPILTEEDKEDDFITELTHHMSHFILQEENDSFDFMKPWDLTVSPDSTLWSPVSYNHGSSEGSSSQEPSPPPTPTPCWKTTATTTATTTYDHVVDGFENNSSTMKSILSHRALIQEQIKAIEAMKQHEKEIQSQKKGNNGVNRVRPRPPRPAPLQTGMRAVFIGGPGSRNGTGVFLPRSGTVAPSESNKKKGKGCSTVLIPARVVQALQQHFDKTAAVSGEPKVASLPPLRDLVVSDKEGMYSLENQQSTKAPKDVQDDMILPQEWTY
ncbi:uncharacterized protein LOC131621737 [Vicia villosa]|uniref:uncharacterized protein LOC131621737 n=1 Tax=Vicia villosa TaxID=3911 RepID=UPI00273B0EA1|nr:uncharacterized protein LOC131621737 [Vicia villosa]